ncbi:MAG: hypothetical protein ACKN94_12095, partial [Pirellulaceae bacterium]
MIVFLVQRKDQLRLEREFLGRKRHCSSPIERLKKNQKEEDTLGSHGFIPVSDPIQQAGSRKDRLNHLSMHIGQPTLDAVVVEGQL